MIMYPSQRPSYLVMQLVMYTGLGIINAPWAWGQLPQGDHSPTAQDQVLEQPSAPPQGDPLPTSQPLIQPLWQLREAPPTLRNEQQAMQLLLGWSTLNLVVGGLAGLWTQGWLQSFMLTNGAWNLINGAIAGSALLATPPPPWTPAHFQERNTHLFHVLLVNVGLDVAYMTAGGFLLERGITASQPTLLGIGASLLLQGGFLLLFDSWFAWQTHQLHQPCPPQQI